MFFGDLEKTKSKKFSFKKLFFFSYLTLILINESNVISGTIINQDFNNETQVLNFSFITEAVKKTGPSVVTIDSQRLVKNRQLSKNSRIFLAPDFERFP